VCDLGLLVGERGCHQLQLMLAQAEALRDIPPLTGCVDDFLEDSDGSAFVEVEPRSCCNERLYLCGAGTGLDPGV